MSSLAQWCQRREVGKDTHTGCKGKKEIEDAYFKVVMAEFAGILFKRCVKVNEQLMPKVGDYV